MNLIFTSECLFDLVSESSRIGRSTGKWGFPELCPYTSSHVTHLENSKARVRSHRSVGLPVPLIQNLPGSDYNKLQERKQRMDPPTHLSCPPTHMTPVDLQNPLGLVRLAFSQRCQTLNMKLGNLNQEEQTCEWAKEAKMPVLCQEWHPNRTTHGPWVTGPKQPRNPM